jgi:putative transcriptional regulator
MRKALAPFVLMLVVLGWPGGGPHGALPADRPEPPGSTTAGKLLVASPELLDPNFRHTVVLMVLHDGDGAMGLVLNRRYGRAPIGELARRLGLPGDGGGQEVELFYGGPVAPGTALVIHSPDYRRPQTLLVAPGIAVTGDAQVLGDMAGGKGPRQAVLTLGYAGWGPGQLETELEARAWDVVPATADLVFAPDPAAKWQRALALRGTDL